MRYYVKGMGNVSNSQLETISKNLCFRKIEEYFNQNNWSWNRYVNFIWYNFYLGIFALTYSINQSNLWFRLFEFQQILHYSRITLRLLILRLFISKFVLSTKQFRLDTWIWNIFYFDFFFYFHKKRYIMATNSSIK